MSMRCSICGSPLDRQEIRECARRKCLPLCISCMYEQDKENAGENEEEGGSEEYPNGGMAEPYDIKNNR